MRSAPFHSPALKNLGAHAPTRGQVGLTQDLPWGMCGSEAITHKGLSVELAGVASSMNHSFQRVEGQRCYFKKLVGN